VKEGSIVPGGRFDYFRLSYTVDWISTDSDYEHGSGYDLPAEELPPILKPSSSIPNPLCAPKAGLTLSL